MENPKVSVGTGTEIDSAETLTDQVQSENEDVAEKVSKDDVPELHWDQFPGDLQIDIVKYLSLKNRVMLKRMSPDFHEAIEKSCLVLDDFTISVAPDGIKYSMWDERFMARHFGETRSFRCFGHGDVQKPVPGEPVLKFHEAALNSMMKFFIDPKLIFRRFVIRSVVDESGYSPRITWFLRKLNARLMSIGTPLNVKTFELRTGSFTPEDMNCLLPHFKPRVLTSLRLLLDSDEELNFDSLSKFEQFKYLRSLITNGIIDNFKVVSHIDYVSVKVQQLSTALVNSLINEMKNKKNFNGLVVSGSIPQPEVFRNLLMKSETQEKPEFMERRYYLREINDELVVEVRREGVIFRSGKQFEQYEREMYLRSLPFKPKHYVRESGFRKAAE